MTAKIATSTLRPGFLVSLKTTVRGNVHYIKTDLDGDATGAVKEWKTKRTIEDPEEHERAKKARGRAASLVRSVCKQSAFGLLCPEVDGEKLDAAVAEARKVVDEFNGEATLSRIGIYILTGRVMPDDVEAVRAINSEIRELMAEMAGGIENGNVDAIREAASKVKGIGEMLATEAQTKVEMAVVAGRNAAKQIVRDREMAGSDGTVSVDKSAVRRINELKTSFLDLSDGDDVAAPKAGAARQLDLETAEQSIERKYGERARLQERLDDLEAGKE